MLRRLPLVLVGLATLGAFGLALFVWWFGRRDRPLETDHLVVLGAKVFPDGTASAALVRRALRAADWVRDHPRTTLVLSGGTVGGGTSEAVALREQLRARGVPVEALHLEERSRTTSQNAAESARWLQSRRVERVNVVTDRFHLLRARQLFRRAGIDAGTVGAAPADMPRFDRLYWVLREGLALLIRPGLLFASAPRRG